MKKLQGDETEAKSQTEFLKLYLMLLKCSSGKKTKTLATNNVEKQNGNFSSCILSFFENMIAFTECLDT